VSAIEPNDAVTQEWLNRPRDVDLRFRASHLPQLALWLVGCSFIPEFRYHEILWFFVLRPDRSWDCSVWSHYPSIRIRT